MSDGTFIHESARVDDGASIGPGTKVWHFSHVMPGARVGRDCMLGQNVFIGEGVRIGDGVRIQNNTSVYSGVTIEDGVFVGPSVVFTNDLSPRSAISKHDRFVPTLVRRGASLGANATILCGVTLGSHCMIGAGAVVTKDVPDHGVAYGNPADRHAWICVCGTKIEFDSGMTVCASCGRSFELQDDGVREVGAGG